MATGDTPFFIKVIRGKIILWDFERHEQYEIDLSFAAHALAAYSDNPQRPLPKELAESGVIRPSAYSDWQWDALSQIFHVGTSVTDNLTDANAGEIPEEYVGYCKGIMRAVPVLYCHRQGDVVAIPPAKELPRETLHSVLRARATSRQFRFEPVDVQTIADVLFWTFGAIHGETYAPVEDAGYTSFNYRRSSASGGCLQAAEPYLLVRNVLGLQPGIYHYQCVNHRLVRISLVDHLDLVELLAGQTGAKEVPFAILITVRFEKLWWKYKHSRAYRGALMDIGCLIQTFQLVSTSLGLDSWPTGMMKDSELNRLLQIDGCKEAVMFCLAGGYGNSHPIRRDLMKKPASTSSSSPT